MMVVTPRRQRRIFIYTYVFKKLGILSDQEYRRITNFSHSQANFLDKQKVRGR